MEALVVVVHGSRQENSGSVMEQLRQDVARRVSCPVHLAYLQFQRPSLPEVVIRLKQAGIHTITVVPAFLALGVHVLQDIPEVLRRVRRQYPELRLFLAPPLGYDPRLADIIMDRIREELKEVS